MERSDCATTGGWWRYSLLVGALWLAPLAATAQTWVGPNISLPTDTGPAISQAAAVKNDDGTVVGTYLTAAGTQGFVRAPGSSWTDLGTLGGTERSISGINNPGQIVGSSDLPGNTSRHAFLWTASGGMADLGTLGGSRSEGLGINNFGHVVGSSDIAGDGATHAFLWTPGSGILDLGTLGGDYSVASTSTMPVRWWGRPSTFADQESTEMRGWRRPR